MSYQNWGPQDLSAPAKTQLPEVPVERGMVLEDVQSGWVGAVTRVEKSGGMHVVALEDRRGKSRSFRLGFGFLLEGQPIRLMPPAPKSRHRPPVPAARRRARSGWRASAHRWPRPAASGWKESTTPSWWRRSGATTSGWRASSSNPCTASMTSRPPWRTSGPGPGRRLGVLVDHLVADSKESRIADAVMASPGAAGNVLIVGHPYVDVWQAIRPAVLGIEQWPVIPRGVDWKTGILMAFGWPHSTKEDIGLGWQKLLGAVRSYADLEAVPAGPRGRGH